ncbi:MAG: YraN family protein [Gemmatimonadota bacterium]|nr:YraN family protein [Gemmatimonadota bacterium]
MAVSPHHGPHALGRRGEQLAIQYLSAAGWTILAGNYRFGRREVDLVVRRAGLIAFVEVKTRAGDGYGRPEDAVTWKKRREIEAVAAEYLVRHPAHEAQIRFDVIAIEVGPDRGVTRLEHIEDAWRPGWP